MERALQAENFYDTETSTVVLQAIVAEQVFTQRTYTKVHPEDIHQIEQCFR